jgi:hypothetical protein
MIDEDRSNWTLDQLADEVIEACELPMGCRGTIIAALGDAKAQGRAEVDAYAVPLTAALEKIAAREPYSANGGTACASCGTYWHPDPAFYKFTAEHHHEHCAYVIARAALATTPNPSGQFAAEPSPAKAGTPDPAVTNEDSGPVGLGPQSEAFPEKLPLDVECGLHKFTAGCDTMLLLDYLRRVPSAPTILGADYGKPGGDRTVEVHGYTDPKDGSVHITGYVEREPKSLDGVFTDRQRLRLHARATLAHGVRPWLRRATARLRWRLRAPVPQGNDADEGLHRHRVVSDRPRTAIDAADGRELHVSFASEPTRTDPRREGFHPPLYCPRGRAGSPNGRY